MRDIKVNELTAQELRDKPVFDRSNEKVATVKDVTGTPGQRRQAILATGGIMGIGAKQVALPLESFSVSPDGRLVLNMSEDQLKLLPETN